MSAEPQRARNCSPNVIVHSALDDPRPEGSSLDPADGAWKIWLRTNTVKPLNGDRQTLGKHLEGLEILGKHWKFWKIWRG